MRKISIFAFHSVVQDKLLAVRYHPKGKDIFSEVMGQWQDVEYLEDFFEKNKDDLKNWDYDVEDAVLETLINSKKFKIQLEKAVASGVLDYVIFKPLHKEAELDNHLAQAKAYGSYDTDSWLRLYAIRIGENQYLITGGCIKLTYSMQPRQHTMIELERLKAVARHLRDIGFDSHPDIGLLEIENNL